ncbi:UNVERIFIED_CONTAM: putative disease resistance protein RXW24L [Sesamum angustifolium]|uniref:Disease resistance protein RXW24L n=1 Tax=Sesamum angustifolium TaxID=2727405 RepID=A0AAW2KG39_9LAMI
MIPQVIDEALQKIYFLDSVFSVEMKGTGMEIVGRCQGSPLAVAVMGASLQKSNLGEWQRVLNALESIEEELGPEEKVERILALSYNRLPHYLKPCFLYLGHFPEEYEGIQVEKLYLLLMAEGFVPAKDVRKKGKKMDSTESHLCDLAHRSLLEMQEEDEPKFRVFKSCRLHDLIRELCIDKGKEEEFFKIAGPGNGNTADLSRSPRLAIHLNKYEEGGSSHIDKANVRSLLVFDTREFQPKSSWPQELSDLKDFKILRILHFDGVDFRAYELPKGMEKLAYLRYLSFQGCYLDKLPTVISSLLNLEILDLRVRRRMIVPNVLSKMKRLSHLYFPVVFVREGQEKLSLDGLIKLEVLENFDTEMCNSKGLPKLEKLRILRVIAQGNEEDLDMIIKCMETNSSELQLSFLDIRKFDCYSSERLSVLKLLLSCQTLDVVHIEGHIGKLPEELKISENFMQIVLNGSELKEDPMPILGALPNLRSLVLSNDAYEGKEMKCSAYDFPELRSLKLLNLHYLETWNVDERSMQNLSTLAIEKCSKLKMLPAGLKFANLKEVKLVSMSKDFVDSINGQLHGGGEDSVSGSRAYHVGELML